MAEGAPLLRAYTGDRIEGSNPFVSATYPFSKITSSLFQCHKPIFCMGFLVNSIALAFIQFHLYHFIVWYELWYLSDDASQWQVDKEASAKPKGWTPW